MADERPLDDLCPSGPRDVHEVAWPGSDKTVSLLQLSCAEIDDALTASRERLRKRGLSIDAPAVAIMLTNEDHVQLCYRALLEPGARDPKARLFKSPDEARGRLTGDQRDYFISWLFYYQRQAAEAWVYPSDEVEPEGAEV